MPSKTAIRHGPELFLLVLINTFHPEGPVNNWQNNQCSDFTGKRSELCVPTAICAKSCYLACSERLANSPGVSWDAQKDMITFPAQ